MDVPPGGQYDTIRSARPGDHDAILAVVRDSGMLPADELAEVATMLRAFLAGTTGDERWLVDDAGPTGVTGVAYSAPERMTDGTWNLLMLAVHPDRQGRGRGAALVERTEAELAGRARVLLIETSGTADFASQRAFYTRLGYEREARIRDFYGPGDDKIVYRKALTGDVPRRS